MTNQQEENLALKEEILALKQSTDKQISDLEARNKELEAEVTRLKNAPGDARRAAEAWKQQCHDSHVEATYEPPEYPAQP